MPSAEPKQEAMSSAEAGDPFQKAVTYLKFKIKNMDQRKTAAPSTRSCPKSSSVPSSAKSSPNLKNLENIQEKITSGQEDLEAAQVAAVAKLPEVTSNIGFLEHTLSRLLTHRDEAAKLERARKQQAKLERVQQDLQRLRRILLIQDVLVNIDERVRAALLAGSDGAPQLTEAQLQQIDAVYKLVTPSREEELPIQDQIAAAAEHLLRLADRSQKKVTGTTYNTLSRTLEAVFESGVFSPPTEQDLEQDQEQQEEEAELPPPVENGLEPVEPEPSAPVPVPEPELVEPELEPEVPLAPVPAPAPMPVPAPEPLLVAAGAAPGSAGDGPAYPQEVLVPVPVPVVPQLPQQPPISFLQESELLRADPAVVGFQPAPTPEFHQIPTQTFTNTNFAGLAAPAASLSDYVSAGGVYAAGGGVVDTTPNPPPPIPLPRQELPVPVPEPHPQPTVAPPPPQPSPPAPAPAPPQQQPPQQPDNAWAARQPTPVTAAPEPAAPAPAPAPAPSTSAWGDQEGDTEIGQWDSGAGQTSWENGNNKQSDSWAENGDSHWGGNDGRRGGYRSRGGPRSRGQTNGGGYGGRGRGGYDRPPRGSSRGGYGGDDRRGGYDDRRGGEQRRGGGGGERPYRGGRGGGRGAGRGGRGAGPPRQQ